MGDCNICSNAGIRIDDRTFVNKSRSQKISKQIRCLAVTQIQIAYRVSKRFAGPAPGMRPRRGWSINYQLDSPPRRNSRRSAVLSILPAECGPRSENFLAVFRRQISKEATFIAG